MAPAELRRRVGRRMADEDELVIHPAFFHALARRLPGIAGVEVLVKRGRTHNELTRFRYDVVLHVGEEAEAPTGPVATAGSLAEIAALLEPGPGTLVLAGLANARLAEEAEEAAIDPEDLWELGERLGYRVRLLAGLGSPSRFDAVLEPRDLPLSRARRTPAVTLEGLDLA
jgi:hypothetical protein